MITEDEAFWAGIAVAVMMLGGGFSMLFLQAFTGFGSVVLALGLMTMVLTIQMRAKPAKRVEPWTPVESRVLTPTPPVESPRETAETQPPQTEPQQDESKTEQPSAEPTQPAEEAEPVEPTSPEPNPQTPPIEQPPTEPQQPPQPQVPVEEKVEPAKPEEQPQEEPQVVPSAN